MAWIDKHEIQPPPHVGGREIGSWPLRTLIYLFAIGGFSQIF